MKTNEEILVLLRVKDIISDSEGKCKYCHMTGYNPGSERCRIFGELKRREVNELIRSIECIKYMSKEV